MNYLITFLGTAGGKESMFQQLRSSAGIVMQFGNYQIHLDPGPGALTKAVEFGINPRGTNIIIASHNHLGHCNDVNVLIDAMTYSGLENRGMLIGDRSVIEGSVDEDPILNKNYKKYLEKINIMEPEEKIKLGTLEIQATPTEHRCETNIGFKFYTARFILGYTSDTKYFSELTKKFEDCNILILNNLRPFGSKTDNDSLSSDDSLEIIEKIKPKLAILTHFGSQILRENPLYQSREIQKQTKVQTIAARDGLILDPINYSTSVKQRTINLY